MEEKELIKKIQALKNIKPNENWVIFTKNQIFQANDAPIAVEEGYKIRFRSFLNILTSFIYQRKFAYSLAAVLLLSVVLGSGMWYNISTTNEETVVMINGVGSVSDIKATVEEFKQKSQSLAQIVKKNPANEKEVLAVREAVEEIKTTAEKLADAVQKEPRLAEEVALEVNNNKTYLEVTGYDLKETSDVLKETSDVLYKTIVEPLLKDVEDASLTEQEEESFQIIKKAFDKGEYEGKYSSALEDILLLKAAIKQYKEQHKDKNQE